MAPLENGGWRPMISGGSFQHRGQSVDSLDGPLFNPNLGYGYHISDAIDTHHWRWRKLAQLGPFLSAIRAWMAAP